MKKARTDEEGNFDTLEERLRQDDFVLLEDWGAEGETEFAMMSGQRVILSRVNELKPILIASDLTPEEMTVRWERAGLYRIIDRLRAVSVISILEGENLRDREEAEVRVKLG